MAKSLFFVIFFNILANSTKAQDTVLVAYPNPDLQFPSLVPELLITDREELVMFQPEGGNQAAILITDSVGGILVHKFIDPVDGYECRYFNHAFQAGDSLVFLGVFDIGLTRCLATIKGGMRANGFRILDTLHFPQNLNILINSIKFLESTGKHETFAYTEAVGTGQHIGYHHIKLNSDFVFTSNTPIQGFGINKSPVYEFTFDSETNLYGVTLFGGYPYFLVDTSGQVVHETNSLKTTYIVNNISYAARHEPFGCVEDNGEVNCFTQSSGQHVVQKYAHLKMHFERDSIYVLEKAFLNTPPILALGVGEVMRRDRNGDYVVSGVNSFTLSTGSTIPNAIGVFKYDSLTYQRKWDLKFTTDASFVVWDMEIGRNNDIYLVGHAQNLYAPNALTGFLLKISPNGLPVLSALPDIQTNLNDPLVYPNPSQGQFSYEATGLKPQTLTIYDVLGRAVFVKSLKQFDFNNFETALPSGTYIWKLESPFGVFSGTWICVK